MAWQTWTASRALLHARSDAREVQSLVTSGDFDGAARELSRLRGHTHQAASATGGVLWDATAHLPVVGDTVQAVQTIASVLDTATRENAPVVLRLSRAVDQGVLRPRNGRIDLAAIRRLTPGVTRAATSIATQRDRLAELDLSHVAFPFGDVVQELGRQVDDASSAAGSTATAFRLLPRMLGAEGPRRYLLLIQNNAEVRATGGIAGSIAILRADHGRVRMGFQGAPRDLGGFDAPVVKVPPDVLAEYGETVATDLRDVNFNPDFPEAARTAAAMWQRSRGTRLDGVLSVDPVALSLLLQGTGPVPVETASLNAGNAVSLLLNRAYQELLDPKAQDHFFATSARAIFDAVMSGRGNVRRIVTGLATGAQQHRVLVWSRHPGEQREIAGTAVAGELPGRRPDQVHVPQVGVYLNDATAGKPEFYLDQTAAVTATRCLPDGRQELRTTVDLVSTMPKDYSRLSRFITGTGEFAPIGTIAFNLRIYGPTGGDVSTLHVDGKDTAPTAERQQDRQIVVVPVGLRPGQRVRVTALMTTGPGQTGDPVLSFTPGVTPERNGVSQPSACR